MIFHRRIQFNVIHRHQPCRELRERERGERGIERGWEAEREMMEGREMMGGRERNDGRERDDGRERERVR